MLDDVDGLSAAIRLQGGVRAVARLAAVDASNLGRFIGGRAGGLSDDAVMRVLAAVGRPGGHADATRVLNLRAITPDHVVIEAFGWLFPQGSRVAWAAWNAMALVRLRRSLRSKVVPTLYAVTDGTARAILLLPPGVRLPNTLYPERLPELRWWNDDADRAVLDIGDSGLWSAGQLTPAEFDAAWPGSGYDPTIDDLVETVRDLGISYGEAIRRIHRGQPA